MAIHKTEAVVLKTWPLRSSSLIVAFYSREFGKLRGVVKGVRREREIRGAYYELFTHLEIIFYEKQRSDLHLISDSAVIESHDRLRRNLETIAYASYFAEMTEAFCETGDPHPDLFELLLFAFRFLPSVAGERMARLFEIRMLNETGMIPYLDRCLECGVEVVREAWFSVAQGALFCGRCARTVADARPLSREVLGLLRYLAGHSNEDCLRQPVGERTAGELADLMHRFFLYRTGEPFKSRRFIESVQASLG